MILVDTSVWINYFNGQISWQTNLLDRKLQTEQILAGDIIITEILQGFRKESSYQAAKKALLALPFASLCGKEIALKSAENFRELRKNGITIRKTIDMIIATYCIERGIFLLHLDKDFEAIKTVLPLKTISE